MSDKLLLYRPSKRKLLSKSFIYVLSIAVKVASLCLSLLLKSIRQKPSIALVDEYIKKFWHINFTDTNTELFVTGKENFDPNKIYIFMSNHESWMDMAAMFAAVPQSLRMISKEGLTKVPILGPAMLSAGFIPINRQNTTKAIKQLEKAKEILKKGVCLWMAPEGTRSRSGAILAFKKGGFYLALDLNVPIVPVYIEGAGAILPPDSYRASTNLSITVHFLKPVEVSDYDKKSLPELIENVRNQIIEKKISLGYPHESTRKSS